MENLLTNLKTKEKIAEKRKTIEETESKPSNPKPVKKTEPTRKYLEKWKIVRKWLLYDKNRRMWCSLCDASIYKIKHLVTYRTMIDGCKSYKVETLKYHEESHGHQMAIEIYNTAE